MNVVFLILDCLREDAVNEETAPNLSRLAEQNLYFSDCVTPANWSLPAHASLFTGQWPHEHKYYHREHQLSKSPLVDIFNSRGYTTVGVSANIYASSSHGFSTGFDNFYETRRPLNPKGLNPFANVRKLQDNRDPSVKNYLETLRDSLTHEQTVASLSNFCRATLMELDRRYNIQNALPLMSDDNYGFLTDASERTTNLLVDTFESIDKSESVYAFANYMDAHYPYEPPKEHFMSVGGSESEFKKAQELNPNISNPRVFLNQFFGERIDEGALNLVKKAYRGEVHSVDEQIGHLLEELDGNGSLEETLIIISSDHGEALGEEDLNDERGMGHLPYLNEHLWRVPLIIAHPELKKATVEKRVSLKSITNLLMNGVDELIKSGGKNYTDYFTEDPILFELPANPYHKDSFENYENIPNWYAERESTTHTILGFENQWQVAASSNGCFSAWKNKVPKDTSDAPESLVNECKRAVEQFPDVSSNIDTGLSDDVANQLEDLGYI